MPLFRKKPVVIEAVQFDPWGPHKYQLPTGVEYIRLGGEDNFAYEGITFFIDTLEGRMEVKRGDWIIRGVAGELYPCKPEIFAATYDAVEVTDGTL